MKGNNNETYKDRIYHVFNEIQTGTNTSDNLDTLIKIFEKANPQEFNDCMEKVFLIIIKNYDKNNVVLKNIKDFLKSFIEKIMKIPKIFDSTKKFINHFCDLFTYNTKKFKLRNLCIYFLNIFLIPYSSNLLNLYESKSLECIKDLIVSTLKNKNTSLHVQLLKLLQKHPELQREKEIWERLDYLLNTSTQIIKKEILKLLEIDNENFLKYLIEMYDDDSVEIRHFVFEKLSEMKNYKMIDAKTKVKLLYVGLSDNSQKIQTSAKKFLKNYMFSLGIFKNSKTHKDEKDQNMDVDGDLEDNPDTKIDNLKSRMKKVNISSRINKQDSDEDEEDEELLETAKDKIEKITSPLRLENKKKLKDSPSRVFDNLDVFLFYNDHKYSYTFQLITDAILEFTDKSNLKHFIKNILDNITSSINFNEHGYGIISDKKHHKNNINMMDISGGSTRSERGRRSFDMTPLFNDIFFLQNTIRSLSSKLDSSSVSLKDELIELLPDNKTFAKIMSHFYEDEMNGYILHQLFLIALNMNYEDESANRDFITFLKKFIIDKDLESKLIIDETQKNLLFANHSQPDEIVMKASEEIEWRKNLENSLENILLPYSRKIVISLEDLLEYALKIFLKIYNNQPTQLFSTIMEPVNEMNDRESNSSNSIYFIKARQKELIEKVKEKISLLENLEKDKKKEKNRLEIDRKYLNEQKILQNLDNELFEFTREENRMLIRMLKLCEFLIKYCKLPAQNFNNMLQDIILPAVQRKEFPDVMTISYNLMGLLAINHFKSFKSFLKLFYNNIQIKNNQEEFREFSLISLFIIFDSLLMNNFANDEITKEIMEGSTVDEKINQIVKYYLYHNYNIPKLITFIGLCKLLIANRIGRPEFILSRLLVIGYKSNDVSEKANDDYNLKIHEIFRNFFFMYSYHNKHHRKSIINAILIILTAHLINDSHIYERSAIKNFAETKFEFLHGLLKHLSQAGQDPIPLSSIIFKVFKYLYFVALYILEDEQKILRGDDENSKNKKVNISYSVKKKIKQDLRKFFERSNYDKYLLEKMTDEHFLKLFPFISNMEEIPLKNISEAFHNHLNSLKEKGYLYEYSGRTIDLVSEEKINEYKNYVNNKEIKYYKTFEDSITFLNSLKEDKFYVIHEENSIINEEDEKLESVSSSLNASRVSGIKKAKQNSIIEEDESVLNESVDKVNTSKISNNKRRSSPINPKKNNPKKKK